MSIPGTFEGLETKLILGPQHRCAQQRMSDRVLWAPCNIAGRLKNPREVREKYCLLQCHFARNFPYLGLGLISCKLRKERGTFGCPTPLI